MTDATQVDAQNQSNASDPTADAAKAVADKAAVDKAQADKAPADQAAADKAAADKAAAESKPVIPDKYEIKPPEGLELDQTLLAEYTPVFKELGLTQEAAQKLVETNFALQQAAAQRQMQAWEAELKADKDFGGKNFETNLADAQKAVGRFLSPEDKAFLDRTGLGSHPGLVKMFLRIGKAISEDATPQLGAGPQAKTAKDIYNHPTSASLGA